MNLNQLKVFYYAAKHGGLSRAAEALFITQPAVTKGIQRLQEQYNLRLFNRFGKKMVLTDAGEVLFDFAEKIFQIEGQAEEIIRDLQQRKKGHIRIDATETFGAYYLPAIVNPLSKSNPHIRISVNILPNDFVVEQTASLNNDLGFISYPQEHKNLIIREVLEDKLVVIAHPDHAFSRKNSLTPAELDGQFIIMHEEKSATRITTEVFFKKHGVSPLIPMELSSNEAIKRAVEQDIGLGIMSRNVVSEEIRKGTLKAIQLSDPSMKRKFHMIHHKDKYISESLQQLIDRVYQWSSN
ncbi:MAG: LysR family transcriptional regulator [Deltaproteobacteria bacterium]|nr:LysR family transcriptional regulator [Deltaproteobacteria bacterium]